MSYGSKRLKADLTQCPTNVREAIDWILRITGKDEFGKSIETMCVNTFLGHVTGGLSSRQDYLNVLINELGEKLAKFTGYYASLAEDKWSLGRGGIGQQGAYKSTYEATATWEDVKNDVEHRKTCAQILLGCMPLIFSGLSYLYWQCNKGKGSDGKPDKRWNDSEQIINLENGSICIYMESMGYKRTELDEKKGSDVKELLELNFEELKKFAKGDNGTFNLEQDPNAAQGSYAEFVNAIQTAYSKTYGSTEDGREEERRTRKKQIAQGRPLDRLYMGAEWYFQRMQQKHNAQHSERIQPANIREMLYWLMCLPYSPVYMGLANGVMANEAEDTEFVCGTKTIPSIADSLDYYLLPPCYYAGFVLMSIQGGLEDASRKSSSPPFLHELYSNNYFQFCYPDNVSEWFGMLWDVVYAVYFRMNFLKVHCAVDPKSFLILSMAIVY
ncbi:uncharacterized protein BXIN_1264 [Babesia sp. Xinjiang]|uniref:uncharacterized protein n=1 Tax=Babesia sp. Xinjiang TaxID=462227 RepID=UPI000A262E57|nr:uncharacterized protein BXIN_1264 [Babesia sp. Xinjiang]ORM40051.1 hypothetical protein BXIN_1264 [Babesia sp. Xinjiang]